MEKKYIVYKVFNYPIKQRLLLGYFTLKELRFILLISEKVRKVEEVRYIPLKEIKKRTKISKKISEIAKRLVEKGIIKRKVKAFKRNRKWKKEVFYGIKSEFIFYIIKAPGKGYELKEKRGVKGGKRIIEILTSKDKKRRKIKRFFKEMRKKLFFR